MIKPRVIAFYLPQFHPIPENDKWWGKGFTEWTNVGRAKPLFKGHYQPRVPADLGYYDLRIPDIREAQAQMAREAGIEGFCYWHYWFGNGKQLLERPFNEVLNSGKPDFPFCLGWANHSWTTKTWEKKKGQMNSMIAEQTYPGVDDYKSHFDYVSRAFKDKRYITVDGKPLFVIFDPLSVPDELIKLWRKWAVEQGFKGIHFVGYTQNTGRILLENGQHSFFPLDKSNEYYRRILDRGYDAVSSIGMWRAEAALMGRWKFIIHRALETRLGISYLSKFDYRDIVKDYYVDEDKWENVYPSLVPQWDRSPRVGKLNGIYVNSTPENFRKMLMNAIEIIKDKQHEHQILFLKSWNEWAEGNYVEPDLVYGHGFLNVMRDVLK